MALTESQLKAWTVPLSTTEDSKCKNAVTQVSQALRNRFGDEVSIFLQGSYKNNTNIKKDSDVDIVLRHDGYFYPDLVFLNESEKVQYNALNSTSGGYIYDTLKHDVQRALEDYFGESQVERKNKCINVKANTTRINADVVPCFVSKRFSTPTIVGERGIKFFPDHGREVISYPEQHYKNGVAKNDATSRMYKRLVRILKNMNSVLIDKAKIKENLISSFTIESLVYNVPNNNFITGDYIQTLKNVITTVYNAMDSKEIYDTYTEVSECLYLFRGGTKSSSDSKLFMLICWQYAGY
ncbi:MAG: nucleotidyltransferase [Chryseobacterium sp.]|nr:MAG: nucleotidyltransferase [Chryseobacterium sp.]